MELDEDEINILTEEEQKIMRNYHNSKLNIYETPENKYFFSLKSDFNNSYEHQQIQNNSVKYLISPSNFIFYALGKECNSIYEAEWEIKNNFNNTRTNTINTQTDNNLKKQIKEIKYKIIEHRFANNPEFKDLQQLINDENFEKKMKENNYFRENVFLNRFFIYHAKSDDIINKYSEFLDPFIYDTLKKNIENNIDDYF